MRPATAPTLGEVRGRDDVHEVTRRLRSRAEAIYGAVFLAPEYRDGDLGLDQIQWYMAGRIAVLGPVAAPVATALFGSFAPGRVRAGLDGVWSRVDPDAVIEARVASAVRILRGFEWVQQEQEVGDAIELLTRGLGAAEVAGHPLFAALWARARPDDPAARLWLLCEMVREHRSAAHVAAWRAAGLDPVEVNVLNELWRGVPQGSIAHVDMGWSANDIDAARDRLVAHGLADADGITAAGRLERDEIERATSTQQASIVDALGADAARLLDLLDPWARAVAAR